MILVVISDEIDNKGILVISNGEIYYGEIYKGEILVVINDEIYNDEILVFINSQI